MSNNMQDQVLVKLDDELLSCEIWQYLGGGRYGITVSNMNFVPKASRATTYQVVGAEVLVDICVSAEELFEMLEVDM